MYSLSVLGGLGRAGVLAPGIGPQGAADRAPGVFDINQSGEVVGRFLAGAGNNVNLQAFSSTGTANLGGTNSQALGINNRNEVVGQSAGFGAAFRTTPDGKISEATPIEGALIGFEINDNGDVVGLSNTLQAFRKFENQPLQGLGSLRSDNQGFSVAYDINRSGVTVGRAVTNSNTQHAFRYGVSGDILFFGPSMYDLGTLGGKNSLARDINDLGLIVGYSEIAENSTVRHAFVTLAKMDASSDLQTLATDDSKANSNAFDINNRLQIVGESDTDIPGEKHAFLHEPSAGMIDLNSLLTPAERSAFVLTSATAIDESGVIIGTAQLKFDQKIRYEEGRVVDGQAGDLFAFRLTPTATKLEAESLNLTGYRLESNSAASGGSLVSLRDATSTTGSISTQLKQVGGTYDIVVNYADENDGNATLNLKINDREIENWRLDKNLGDGNPTEQTFTQRVISNVVLRYGDTLSLTGTANGSEWARVDSIELIPRDFKTIWQAEDFSLNTYQLEDNAAAANRRLISLRNAVGAVGTASRQFNGRSGIYDIKIGYVDETDGVSQLNVKVNDQSIDTWSLNKNLGNPDPVEQTFVERTIKNVVLKPGDTFSITGTRDGAEGARVDYVELFASPENATKG